MHIKIVSIAWSFFFLAACNSPKKVSFVVSSSQTAIVRDGMPALVSKKSKSIVMDSPASRQIQAGSDGRLVYTIAATNLTKAPVDLKIADISALQTVASGSTVVLPVIPYEQLVSEEKTRQVMMALAGGLAAGANSYAAARSGYGTANGTVYGPYGSQSFSVNYYNPTAAAISQSNANMQNEAMISNLVETGQRNMAGLEANVLKDNTLMPGEWIGGKVYFWPPTDQSGAPKNYTISVTIAGETHEIQISQTREDAH